MTKIQKIVLALKKQHGTWRAAAEATGVDHAYLYRLASGEKTRPDDGVLAKLGVMKRVIYSRLESVPQEQGNGGQ